MNSRLGRALALATISVAGLALAGCSLFGGSAPGDDPTPTATDSDVFTITVGDCLNEAALEGTVSAVPLVDCATPHDSEAYASTAMDDGSFPGAVEVKKQAEAECTTQFNEFVGVNYDASTLTYSYFYPTQDSWAQGDREIVCLIDDPAGQTTGTLKGAAR